MSGAHDLLKRADALLGNIDTDFTYTAKLEPIHDWREGLKAYLQENPSDSVRTVRAHIAEGPLDAKEIARESRLRAMNHLEQEEATECASECALALLRLADWVEERGS